MKKLDKFSGKDSVFASRLRELMKKRELTQFMLSKDLDISRQAIAQYCEGSSQATVEKVYKIATYFGVSADYLLGLTDVRNPDLDNKAIHSLLGLSEQSIIKLRNARLFYPVETVEGKALMESLGNGFENPLERKELGESPNLIQVVNILLEEPFESILKRRTIDCIAEFLRLDKNAHTHMANEKGELVPIDHERVAALMLVDIQQALVRLKEKTAKK